VGLLFPFNQASNQDVEALVNYVYANPGMDPDSSFHLLAFPRMAVRLTASTIGLSLLTV